MAGRGVTSAVGVGTGAVLGLWFELAVANAFELAHPAGNGLGGYSFGTSTTVQSMIRPKQAAIIAIDLRSMKN
jgi:hypothetical protein